PIIFNNRKFNGIMLVHVISFPIVEKNTIYIPIKIENVIKTKIENTIILFKLRYIFANKSY
ncbi:MAG: hypothetical protein ACTHLL_04485, partial [Candidatus Nitrosocosmicus sp.]